MPLRCATVPVRAKSWEEDTREPRRCQAFLFNLRAVDFSLASEPALPYIGRLMPTGLPKTIGRDDLREALRRHRGKVAPIAMEFGVSRQTVYSTIAAYGLSRRKETLAERRARMRATRMAALEPTDGESSAA